MKLTSRRTVLTAALLGLSARAWAQPIAPGFRDEKDDLKKRFAGRYAALLRLKTAGKIGETPEGLVDVVKASFAGERVDPKDPKSPKISDFLALENKDRDRLYELLAEGRKESPKDIARQNALRNYKKAEPTHYLLVKGADGKLTWKQMRTL